MKLGDRVQPNDAIDSEVKSYRTMQGEVVFICDNKDYVMVLWDMDKKVVGLRPSKRRIDSLKQLNEALSTDFPFDENFPSMEDLS